MVKVTMDELYKGLDYLYEYDSMNIDYREVFKFSRKEKQIISRIANLYYSIETFQDAPIYTMQRISEEETRLYSNYILFEMFPDKIDQILFLDKKTKFMNIDQDDAGLIYILHKDKIEIDEICVKSKSNPTSITTLNHEKTHGLTFLNILKKELFKYPIELFPFIVEKITAIKLEEDFKYENTEVNNQIERIENSRLAFNNYADSIYIDSLLGPQEKIDFDSLGDVSSLNLQRISDICVSNYERIDALNYILSEVYSALAIKYYQIDERKMLERLRKIFNGKSSIEDFMKYYNINLFNKDIVPTIKENTSKAKKIIIAH